jgi:hypothetical protein
MRLTKSTLRTLIKEELQQTKSTAEVLVRGYGRMRIDQIQRRVVEDLSDMAQKAAAGNFRAIGTTRLNILILFLKTLGEHDALDESILSINEQEPEKIKLQQKGITRGKQVQQLRQTASGVQKGEIAGEFTNIERSLVQQISNVITQIASAPDVDLGKYRTQVNTILNRLKQIAGAEFGREETETHKRTMKQDPTYANITRNMDKLQLKPQKGSSFSDRSGLDEET